ncbi:MAG TPA: ABC transporter permease [Candidatus Saccharimonadales bacterium]|nr:ABC transporter permease [Candidatus Saccharimonadales bacterium]
MRLRSDNFRLAYRNLRATKARSFLTMLGIIIGVMAVILVICIGQGVKHQIADELGRYGKNVFLVQPGPPGGGGSLLTGLTNTNSSLLTENDLRTVRATKGVADAVPLSTVSGSVTGDFTVQSPFIIATTPEFSNVINQPMQAGGFFDGDTSGVVLGVNIAQKLFNDNNPLGQALVWHGQRFLVAGVFKDFNAPPFSLEANFNDAIFISYSAAQKLSGTVLGIYQILAKADGSAQTAQVIMTVGSKLVAAHNGARDVNVAPAAAADSKSDQAIHLLTLLVAGAAIIALIVGGVGIMDVMLVSVTERMYEIGIRKAIGATNRQILRQFVAEAFVLSALGACVGVFLSCVAVGLLRAYTSLEAVLVWQVLVLAPIVAVAIGLFFGTMPAIKAARKDPIEALRHD